MWRGSAMNASRRFQRAFRLKTNDERVAKTDSIVGFSFITSRCEMNRGKSFAGTRLALTSKIESKTKRGCEVKTWHYAKKSTALRCSKKSSVRRSNYTVYCGKSPGWLLWTQRFSFWARPEWVRN